MEEEGVIKFSAQHQDECLPESLEPLVRELGSWRHILRALGLVGQNSNRYAGAGFGNMSARTNPPSLAMGRRAFLITGSQTGGLPSLGIEDCALVTAYSTRENRVESKGATLPSSESLTHAAIYDLSPHIRYVFHAHAPTLWQAAQSLRLPTTRAEVPYGTQEMALEVRRLYRESGLAERGILAMAGHEDGIIAFGHRAEEAGHVLIASLARAGMC